MKAVIYEKYGAPEVLKVVEVDKPVPEDNEVLIKIIAATVNRTDTGFRSAEYFIIRFFNGFTNPKNKILGTELAGIVEKVGKNVKTFKPGDEVFGLSTKKFSTHAEYITLPENSSIALKPVNMSFEEAAAVCDGLFLALNYLRKIDFQKAKKIMVNGASGSIGSAFLQLAKNAGADITAVTNTKNIELIRSLGANDVIDYTKEDFTQRNQSYDIIMDAVGKSSYFKCRKIMNPGSIYFSTELGYLGQNVWLPAFNFLLGNKKIMFPLPTDTKEDIIYFKKLIEEGHYKAIIDRCYTFNQIIEAHTYVESQQKTGNVVLKPETN